MKKRFMSLVIGCALSVAAVSLADIPPNTQWLLSNSPSAVAARTAMAQKSLDATLSRPHANSTVTNQGGSSGKNCDNATIPAATTTQVESDNAVPPPNTPWNYIGTGQLDIKNSTANPTPMTIDEYEGDQTVCGTTIACYNHQTVATLIPIPPSASMQANWHLGEFAIASGVDAQAEYVFVTTGAATTCVNGSNAYFTEEHD